MSLVLLLLLGGGAGAGTGGSGLPIRLGGSLLQLLSARGSLWVVICDRRCSGEARRSVGRIVRIDPGLGRVVASATVERPGAIAVGDAGVFATDFWRGRIRRLDPQTLREAASLRLVLPFEVSPGDDAFLPNDVSVGGGAVWVSTQRCRLARVDSRLRQVVVLVRLPCDAYQTMAFGAGSLWVSESLAGLYRIDPAGNRVVARIKIGPRSSRLVPVRLLVTPQGVLAIAAWTRGGSLTGSNGLARMDPRSNRAVWIRPLPAGRLVAALGGGSLWVAGAGGSTLERIDPGTGRPIGRLHADVGTALAAVDGALWSAFRDGTVRRIR